MTELNDFTMERIAGKVIAAIENEKLINKEAAEILGFSPTYLSNIKRSDGFKHIPRKAWEVMHDFVNSGKPLKEYKSLIKQEVEDAQQPELPVTTTVMPPVPRLKYILTKDPEPKKRGPKTDKVVTAKKLREEFNASKAEQKKPEELDPKTGTLLATIEFYDHRLNIIFPR